MQTTASTRTQACQILQSGYHSSMDRLLQKYGAEALINNDQLFTLESRKINDKDLELHLIETTARLDCRTAATYALIYTCSKGDLELAKEIITDLRKLIDINALIDDRSIAEWAIGRVRQTDYMSKAYRAYLNHMKDAMSICRYLIICYGPKIDLNRPRGLVLKASLRYDAVCEDVVHYLVKTYGADLVHGSGTYDTFETLIRNNHDDDAELYLTYHKDLSARDLFSVVYMPVVHHGSPRIFEVAMAMFGDMADPRDLNYMFNSLCDGFASFRYSVEEDNEKIRMGLDLWAKHLIPKTVEECLINLWRQAKRGKGESKNCIAKEIIAKCLDLIKDNGIKIALAICCGEQNRELFDQVFASNIEQINANPQLLWHAILECCNLKNLSTFKRMLTGCKALVGSAVFELWCEANSAEAITMLFEADKQHRNQLAAYVAPALITACRWNYVELAETLIRCGNESIQDSDYLEAFRIACYYDHENIVRLFIMFRRQRLDFKCNADVEDELRCCGPTIIRLLNDVYGTTVDPASSKRNFSGFKPYCYDHIVKYDNREKACYEGSSFRFKCWSY